jgi:propane monooxygenase coupling protein
MTTTVDGVTNTDTPRQRRSHAGYVGVSLIGSDETEAAIELLRLDQPGTEVSDRGVYWKVERLGSLTFDMAKLSELLERDIDVPEFLVQLSSYYGRIEVSDGRVELRAEILPRRFQEESR